LTTSAIIPGKTLNMKTDKNTPATATDDVQQQMQRFWGDVYRTAYSTADQMLDADSLDTGLDALADMLLYRGHLISKEMPLANLSGKKVLEIGSGAGGHSAMFARHGAELTSLDITLDRVAATREKLRLLGSKAKIAIALQGNAEALPFSDGSFDIVYSNGVLHHTPNTAGAVDEIYRVLRPGGRAAIMLYCKSSVNYWFTLWFCVGILKGAMFRHSDWLGRHTEWIGREPQTARNPVTRCYTAQGIRSLFHKFAPLKIRKGSFEIRFIPKLGRLYERWQRRRLGTHPGGLLVYGSEWPVSSRLELFLGRYIGWDWYISATKPGTE
jgi:ubiquinone/menaquinone biosynthesis C-methylase UbiE